MPDNGMDETQDSEASPAPPSRRRIGDFELIRELGRGGMGVVYEARQVSLNRRVALKLLPPGLGLSERAVARFQREARAAARLHHTNIVPVYAIGEEDGNHYYAMELIEGQSLAQVLFDLSGRGSSSLMEATVTQIGPQLPAPKPSGVSSGTSSGISTASGAPERRWFQTTAHLIAEVADALHYAHRQGILHRDIKPGNLMLSREGRLCVTDFGLARMAQEPAMTLSGLLLGSPFYMSPEQVTAGRTTLDHRTDVYSLGVVLYEMLTLEVPFAGDSRETVLTAIVTKEPAAPRALNPRVPLDLETICLKAMEKDPDRRYASAGEMAEDLRRYLHGELITARRAGVARRCARWLRRHPLATTILLASIGLFASGLWAWYAAERAASERAARYLLDAELARGRGEDREGLRLVEEALGLEPGLADARLLRADLLVALGRSEDAAEDARKALERDPDNLSAHLILARATGTSRRERTKRWRELQERFPPERLETAEIYYLRSFLAENDDAAVELLDRAIELDPAHDDALRARANRHLRAKRLSEALADCDRLISARPGSAPARRLRAEVLLATGEDRQAREEIDRAIALDPEDPESFVVRGRLQCQGDRKSVEGAMADLDEAIRLDPESGRLYEMRGWCNLVFHRDQSAVDDARAAIDLGSKSVWPYKRLVEGLRRLGRDDEALEVAHEYARSVDDASNWWSFDQAAKLYLEDLRDPSSALSESDRAVEIGEGHWEPFVTRHRIRSALGDRSGAASDCEEIAAAEVEGPGELLDRGVTLASLCRLYDAAIADLDQAVSLRPEWAGAWLERGWAKVQAGRAEQGLADYGKAIALAPEFLRAYNARASVLIGLERWEEALADFDRATAIEPNRFAACNRLVALFYLGREAEAREGYADCLAYSPDDPVTLANLALICKDLGRTDEAISHLERAVSIDPSNSYVRVSLAGVRASSGDCEAAASELSSAASGGLRDPLEKANFASLLLLDMHYFCPALADIRTALRYLQELSSSPAWDMSISEALVGVARYRDGDLQEARAALQTSVAHTRMSRLESLFFLAMTEKRLGDDDAAASSYRRALELLAESGDYGSSPVIQKIREEAAGIIGP